MPMRAVKVRDVFDPKRALPRMSWSPENLYNLWQRTTPKGPLAQDTNFSRSSKSVFQQRWKAKRLIRGYHGDHIGQTKFERWYLPTRLPSIHASSSTKSSKTDGLSSWVDGRERGGGRNRDDAERERRERDAALGKDTKVPVGSMMFSEVERRLDVLVFRACFATSVWQAKGLVQQGHVKLNGEIVTNANTLLNPGDIFTVNPSAIEMLSVKKGQAKEAAEKARKEEEKRRRAEEQAARAAEAAAEASAKAAETGIQGAEGEATSEESSAESIPQVATDTASLPEQAELSSSGAPAPSPPSSESSESTTPSPSETEIISTPAEETVNPNKTYFTLPPYASPHIFVPAYLLPSYLTCSAVYVRHPTARAGYSEIPTPFDAGGELMSLGWEWFVKKAPRMRGRTQRWLGPERKNDVKPDERRA